MRVTRIFFILIAFISFFNSCDSARDIKTSKKIIENVARNVGTKLSLNYQSKSGIKSIRIQFLLNPEDENEIGEVLLMSFKQFEKQKILYSQYTIVDKSKNQLSSYKRSQLSEINKIEELAKNNLMILQYTPIEKYNTFFVDSMFTNDDYRFISKSLKQLSKSISFKGFFIKHLGNRQYIVFQYDSDIKSVYFTYDFQEKKIAGFDLNY